jgi:cytochrome c oxidase subunit 2
VKLSAAGERGKNVAEQRGCTACHTPSGGSSTGPTWKDLAGSTVELEDGTTKADDDYLRRAITDPKAEVVKDYAAVMPAYADLTDRQLDDLIAYLHDLSSED